MHLKSLELVGFKSFAERTILEFGDGISAIVGPNGCGKSNISDAIRWVLGEQSARLLRGTKMEDCVFNGTDEIAPKNMAEVSLMLADCEKLLGTDYHEVTVTRRVFRSGEGQYFINKTPCRLKDIQRLFMDTGLGTNSYSVMEQGKIDLILRARPEDRREVFEEASGITKYKADKREALRRLEQTESNLLRLADIIKEVKRQIISIQRQAGKAERYKKLFEQLRAFDGYASREKLQSMAAEMNTMEAKQASFVEKNEALQHEIERLELDNGQLQDKRAKIESEISALQQSAIHLDSQTEQLRHSIDINNQRLKEHEGLVEHDASDISAADAELARAREALGQGNDKLEKSKVKLQEAEDDLKNKSAQNFRHEEQLDKTKHNIQQLLTESLELEDRLAKSQNELHQLENSERSDLIRRERCSAEQAKLRLDLEKQQESVAAAEKIAREMTQDLSDAGKKVNVLLEENRQHEEKISRVQAEAAEIEKAITSVSAQLELLAAESDAAKSNEEISLHGIERESLLGRLYEHVEVHPDYRVPFEALLSDYLNALVVSDIEKAVNLFNALEKKNDASLSMVAADMQPVSAPGANPPAGAEALVEKIKCVARFRPLFARLLRDVYVVDSIEFLKQNFDPAITYVTHKGGIVGGNGTFQVGVVPKPEESRKRRFDELNARLPAGKKNLFCLQDELQKLIAVKKEKQVNIEKEQTLLNERRENLARQQGQYSVIKAKADQLADNLETVSWELQEIEKHGNSAERKSELIAGMDDIRARRVVVKRSLEELNETLKTLEQTHKTLHAEVVAANINAVQYREEVQHIGQMSASLKDRIGQLESMISSRNKRIREYESAMESLKAAGVEAGKRIPQLKAQKEEKAARLAQAQSDRSKILSECKSSEDNIRRLRADFELHRNQQSDLNGKIIELRMRREHILERTTTEYHISPEMVLNAAEPAWPESGKPSMEQLDSQISELRAKIDAMGPVNTGAIEELQQLQERYDFLSKQQEDLVKARQQLHEAIRKINQTTTEMFAKTFAQINENFQTMFSQLFGGGTAKLILTDEGDVLECGIEIYARPPGKKLQSISLLSGGESTMTAVALLFAIFMVKPSPFCVLDELDAALDDANNQRFINMLKGFLKDSQFIVITHNRQTIAAAGVLYGVTMEKDKISTIVSMRFNSAGKAEPDAAQAAALPQTADSKP